MALVGPKPPKAKSTQRLSALKNRFRPIAVHLSVIFAAVAFWTLVSQFSSPWFFPSPLETLRAAFFLLSTGDLQEAVAISYFRILSGWSAGCLVAAPLALIAGRSIYVQRVVEPIVNFFRFVPPIALLGIAILWFGIGELSKVAIIFYTSTFTVFMSTMAGAMTIDETPSRAARSLGADRFQVLWRVVLPATIPAILVGMRIGMGFSFMTVIAAELVAADNGVGFLIFNARLFLKTANAFAGIITLGLMGLVADFLFRRVAQAIFRQHSLPF